MEHQTSALIAARQLAAGVEGFMSALLISQTLTPCIRQMAEEFIAEAKAVQATPLFPADERIAA